VAGFPGLIRVIGADEAGVAIIRNYHVAEGSPQLNAGLSSAQSGTRYRVTAKSVTVTQDANSVSNNGTMYAADVRNSYARGNTGLIGCTSADRATYYWRGLSFASIAEPTILSTMPGAVSWPASQGVYAVSRNTGAFDWARADSAYVQDPLFAGTFGGGNNADTNWEPCLDWSVPAMTFMNLSSGAQYPVKFITCYEIIPELSSIFQDNATLSATNLAALSLYKTASEQFQQFYPADFNDWGTLWNGVKSFFSSAKPLLSGAAKFIPGAGPVISSMIDLIPVSKDQKMERARQQTEEATQRATTEAAINRNAARVLSDGKASRSAIQPMNSWKPQKTKLANMPTKSNPTYKGFACGMCHKPFPNEQAMLSHRMAKHPPRGN